MSRLVYEWVTFSSKTGICMGLLSNSVATHPYQNQTWVPPRGFHTHHPYVFPYTLPVYSFVLMQSKRGGREAGCPFKPPSKPSYEYQGKKKGGGIVKKNENSDISVLPLLTANLVIWLAKYRSTHCSLVPIHTTCIQNMLFNAMNVVWKSLEANGWALEKSEDILSEWCASFPSGVALRQGFSMWIDFVNLSAM